MLSLEHSLGILSWFSFRHCSMRFLRHDLRLLRGLRRMVNHRVSVFHPDAVSPGLRSKQLHQCVIVFLFCPVALPFEEGCDGGQPHCFAHLASSVTLLISEARSMLATPKSICG